MPWKEGTPNPGSDEAIKQGCTCVVMDNCHGWGTLLYGKGTFWITETCPLHGKNTNADVKHKPMTKSRSSKLVQNDEAIQDG